MLNAALLMVSLGVAASSTSFPVELNGWPNAGVMVSAPLVDVEAPIAVPIQVSSNPSAPPINVRVCADNACRGARVLVLPPGGVLDFDAFLVGGAPALRFDHPGPPGANDRRQNRCCNREATNDRVVGVIGDIDRQDHRLVNGDIRYRIRIADVDDLFYARPELLGGMGAVIVGPNENARLLGSEGAALLPALKVFVRQGGVLVATADLMAALGFERSHFTKAPALNDVPTEQRRISVNGEPRFFDLDGDVLVGRFGRGQAVVFDTDKESNRTARQPLAAFLRGAGEGFGWGQSPDLSELPEMDALMASLQPKQGAGTAVVVLAGSVGIAFLLGLLAFQRRRQATSAFGAALPAIVATGALAASTVAVLGWRLTLPTHRSASVTHVGVGVESPRVTRLEGVSPTATTPETAAFFAPSHPGVAVSTTTGWRRHEDREDQIAAGSARIHVWLGGGTEVGALIGHHDGPDGDGYTPKNPEIENTGTKPVLVVTANGQLFALDEDVAGWRLGPGERTEGQPEVLHLSVGAERAVRGRAGIRGRYIGLLDDDGARSGDNITLIEVTR